MSLFGEVADAIEVGGSRFATPGDLAAYLDPRTVQTEMLDLLDEQLLEVAGGGCERLIWSCPPQEGKLVADSTPVPTPEGWTTHGQLRVGDMVFHPSGTPVRVTAVHEPAQASMLVHTSDHGAIKVHPRHEWTVWDRVDHQLRTVETQYLAGVKLYHGPESGRGGKYRFHLPLREALELPDADLPIDPYTLGVWLGNGSSSKPAVTHQADDEYTLAYPVSARCVHSQTGVVTTYYRGGMLADLRAAGVLDNKHIPAVYLRSSEKQRRALLAGLIDTDGHVAASGQVSFDNANEQMVRDVAELLRTLGYRAHVHRPTAPRLSSSGIQGRRPMWRVTYTPHDAGPARLARKASTKVASTRWRVAITAVSECEPEVGRCITVDSPDGLYLVGETFVPTHNSVRVSRVFPLWLLLRNPDARIVIASYEHGIARRWGRQIRDEIVAHPEFGLRVRPDSSAAHEWQLEGHDGGVVCVGIGGALTGRPIGGPFTGTVGGCLIIDDPLKGREEADSEAFRAKCVDWWQETASTRLAPRTPVVLIQTRWHEEDLAGHLLTHGTGWRHMNVPAQADHDAAAGECDLLGRDPGDWLVSARGRTEGQWEQIRRQVGSRGWAALYQGRPSPGEGGVFQRSWWRFYERSRVAHRSSGAMHAIGAQQVIQSWDMAFKDTKTSDYVVGQVWAKHGSRVWLLDQVRARMDFPTTLDAVRMLSAKWPQASAKLIEDKANGPAIISLLRNEIPGIVPVTPRDSKEARASAVSPFVEAGDVELPAAVLAPWIGDFIEEVSAFPNGAHDDQVDAMTQALARLLMGGTTASRFMRQLIESRTATPVE